MMDPKAMKHLAKNFSVDGLVRNTRKTIDFLAASAGKPTDRTLTAKYMYGRILILELERRARAGLVGREVIEELAAYIADHTPKIKWQDGAFRLQRRG